MSKARKDEIKIIKAALKKITTHIDLWTNFPRTGEAFESDMIEQNLRQSAMMKSRYEAKLPILSA